MNLPAGTVTSSRPAIVIVGFSSAKNGLRLDHGVLAGCDEALLVPGSGSTVYEVVAPALGEPVRFQETLGA